MIFSALFVPFDLFYISIAVSNGRKKWQKFERDKIMQSDGTKWCNTCQRLSYHFTFFGRVLIKHISIKNIRMIAF